MAYEIPVYMFPSNVFLTRRGLVTWKHETAHHTPTLDYLGALNYQHENVHNSIPCCSDCIHKLSSGT